MLKYKIYNGYVTNAGVWISGVVCNTFFTSALNCT